MFLLSFFISAAALAQTSIIFLDGAMDGSNYYRYYNEIRHGYELARSRNMLPRAILENGEWTWKKAAKPDGYISVSSDPSGLDQFNHVATPEQQQKYQQLLECEREALE